MRLIDANLIEEIFKEQGYDYCAGVVYCTPTIDAEPVKYGKWTITECFDFKNMTCSYCGWLYEYHAGMEEEWNYCPHCGARMDGE